MIRDLTKSLKWWLLLGIFTACGVSTNDAKEANPITKQNFEEEDYYEEENLVKFILPSTVQIGQLFSRAGLRYVDGIVNPVENLTSYSTKTSKMLAYGIYSTDLSYCVLNDQNQQSLLYLGVLEDLSEDIGFSEIFQSNDLFNRFEKNVGKRDSVVEIMIQIQEKTDYFVEDYEMDDDALIVFVGAWIEGMYIGVKATNEMNKQAISLRLLEQMSILDNLLLGLKSQRSNLEVDKLYNDLSELKEFFDNIDEVKNANKSLTEIEISFTNLTWVAENIISIRKDLIN